MQQLKEMNLRMSPQVAAAGTACDTGGTAVRNGESNNRRVSYVIQDRPGSGNRVHAHHGYPFTRGAVSQIMEQTRPERRLHQGMVSLGRLCNTEPCRNL